MVTSHPEYDDGVLRVTRTAEPPGLAIAGEIDESTYPALLAALRELPGTPPEVHLDLAGVSYCDLAGLRAIVRLASPGAGRTGRPVTLHHVPEQLRGVLEIIGWDTIPGLSVAGPG
jgi:ABC-type transporter Mla MlaB component